MLSNSGLVWGALSVIAMLIVAATVAECWFRAKILSLPSSVGQRIGTIDGLRGYLAIAVLAHHFPVACHWALTGEWKVSGVAFFDNLGPVAVSCFFMITGLLFYQRFALSARKPSWLNFFVNRFFRVAPIYYLAAASTFLVVMVLTGSVSVNRGNAISIASWLLFTIHGQPPLNGFPTKVVTAGVFWTLRYEWAFYLSLPLIAFIFKPIRGNTGIRIGLLALGFMAISMLSIKVYGFETSIIRAFLLGMMTAEILKSQFIRNLAARQITSFLASFAVLSAIVLPLPAYSTVPLLLTFAFFTASACGCTMFGLLAQRASILLGEISYGIYALHGLVLFGFVTGSSVWLSVAGQSTWLALPGIAFLVVTISAISYRYIEKPGIELGRRVACLARGAPVVDERQSPPIGLPLPTDGEVSRSVA